MLQCTADRSRYTPGNTCLVGWCSWSSRQSNTLKVPSSNLGSINDLFSGRSLLKDVMVLQPFLFACAHGDDSNSFG